MMVAAACFFGFIIKSGVINFSVIKVVIGTFLLSSACSILNQIQEKNTDALMKRTAKRPLPENLLSKKNALIISIMLFILSFIVFKSSNNGDKLIILSLVTVFIYNGLYTPLKKITPFALLVGAIMGSFPPIFGWISGGGDFFDKEIISIAIVFFLWQTPHFWLLLDSHKQEYINAGFPTLFENMDEKNYKMLMGVWIIAFAVSLLILPFFILLPVIYGYFLAIISFLMVILAIFIHDKPHFLFHLINSALLLSLLIITLGRFINTS